MIFNLFKKKPEPKSKPKNLLKEKLLRIYYSCETIKESVFIFGEIHKSDYIVDDKYYDCFRYKSKDGERLFVIDVSCVLGVQEINFKYFKEKAIKHPETKRTYCYDYIDIFEINMRNDNVKISPILKPEGDIAVEEIDLALSEVEKVSGNAVKKHYKGLEWHEEQVRSLL